MRAGACTVQQTLTAEALSVVKQSVSLARRRGHAQVTPLHVAATLLSSRTSILRRACLKSHPLANSHPLQCRALELCFNVALNRLPTIAGPLVHGQPSLSNALVAALKRAQAHQRRGCLEQQQQPLLAIKVELEQLVISILDDPSVSRVMREAGFSSTCVKNNLEDSAGAVFPSPAPYFCDNPVVNATENSFWHTQLLNSSSVQCLEQNPLLFSQKKPVPSSSLTDLKEDFRLVLEVLLRKKRKNTVVVGDCSSITEGVVAELMGKVERGEVPDQLRSVMFIKFQFPSFSVKMMKREEVESRVADLRRRVEASVGTGGGAIIYAGDLKWVVETEANVESSGYCYSPVQHLITELGRMLSDLSSQSRVWLIATASYNTYMKCQMKQPPLEIQWALQAVAVPSGGLALALHASSGLDSRETHSQNLSQIQESKPFCNKEEGDTLSCCSECATNYEKEAANLKSSSTDITHTEGSTHLPYWLQQHRTDNLQKEGLFDLRRKWNRLCNSSNHSKQDQLREMWREGHLDGFQSFGTKNCIISNMPTTQTYSTSYPCWSNTLFYNQNNSFWPNPTSISFTETAPKPNLASNFMASWKTQQQSWAAKNGAGNSNSQDINTSKPLSLDCFRNKEVKTTLSLSNNPSAVTVNKSCNNYPFFSTSVISTDQRRQTETHCRDLQRELIQNIPWQSETVPSIAEALKQEHNCYRQRKNCFLVLGSDWIGKKRMARVVAEFYFGSVDRLLCMNMRRTGENHREMLTKALICDSNCVVLIEEIDHASQSFLQFISDVITDGKFRDPIGSGENLAQTLFIMTMNSSIYHEEKHSVIQMKLQVNFQKSNDSNDPDKPSTKRKAEWDFSSNSKYRENQTNKKQFLKQSSFNNLDLNLCAQETDPDLDESNAVHSDLTQETVQTSTNHHMEVPLPNGFLRSIEKQFVFDTPTQFNQMSDPFLIKFVNYFEEVIGERGGNFHVDESLLQKLVRKSPYFLNSFLEKWLKNVFQKSLEKKMKEKREKVSVRLCCVDGNKEDNVPKALEFGFEGSNLPNRIEVIYKD